MKSLLPSLLLTTLLATPTLAKDLTVSPDASAGSGDYKTIQEAINATPDNATSYSTIHIKPGTYKEKLVIPKTKPFLHLLGDDPKTTILTNDWNSHHLGDNGREVGTFGSFSTQIAADNVTAENLTFENTAGDTGQALALAAVGDRQIYRNCRLLGWQDTLYANSGRQYYDRCFIEGRVDFIFGNAVAVFDHCTIHSKNGGHVTAASTDKDQPWGYVFLDCTLTGDPVSYRATTNPAIAQSQAAVAATRPVMADLGRPWRPNAAVAFIRCELGPHIKPDGWSVWTSQPTNHLTARYYEYQCTGPGADRSKRLDWTKVLPDDLAKEATLEKILAGKDNWNPK